MKTHEEWGQIKNDNNTIGLARLIRKAMYSRAATKSSTLSYLDAEVSMLGFRQGSKMSNSKFIEVRKSRAEVFETVDGEPG